MIFIIEWFLRYFVSLYQWRYFSVFFSISLKTEKTLESLILFVGVVSVVNTASAHDAFLVEKLQVACNKYTIFLKSFWANNFRVVWIWNYAVNALLLKDFGKLMQVFVNNKAMSFPHGSSEIVIGENRNIIGLTFSSIWVSVALFWLSLRIMKLSVAFVLDLCILLLFVIVPVLSLELGILFLNYYFFF